MLSKHTGHVLCTMRMRIRDTAFNDKESSGKGIRKKTCNPPPPPSLLRRFTFLLPWFFSSRTSYFYFWVSLNLLINTILLQGNTYIRQLDEEDNCGSGSGRPKIFQIWINAPLIFFSLFPKLNLLIWYCRATRSSHSWTEKIITDPDPDLEGPRSSRSGSMRP
jgi:hypothetical protein